MWENRSGKARNAREGFSQVTVAGMRYARASMGRIFVARVDHGEDLIGGMQDILSRERVSHAVMLFLGALSEGEVVTGPEEPVIPPSPHTVMFGGGWEVVGVATVYPGEEGPAIHLHGSVGKGNQALTGCLRAGQRRILSWRW